MQNRENALRHVLRQASHRNLVETDVSADVEDVRRKVSSSLLVFICIYLSFAEIIVYPTSGGEHGRGEINFKLFTTSLIAS